MAFQYQQTEYVPYGYWLDEKQEAALNDYYGDESWRSRIIDYIGDMGFIDGFLSANGMIKQSDGSERDCFGSSWKTLTGLQLVDWPLKEPKIGKYKLPDLGDYVERHIKPQWPEKIEGTSKQFRTMSLIFGLFERSWSLRGFENFCMDLVLNQKFAEELLESITEWYLQGIDLMAAAPIDAVFFGDDHACQRGMIMGEDRWRQLFKPRWKQIFERVHHYGFYIIMHMCGDTSAVVPDLIEIGLDCMESCQPECMDIYELKKRYGRDIRFWGGLGAQSILPFGSADEVAEETRQLKREMGRGGGYVLWPSKPAGPEVPIANIAAYLEEAARPRL